MPAPNGTVGNIAASGPCAQGAAEVVLPDTGMNELMRRRVYGADHDDLGPGQQ
ncbi:MULTISPECIES: hypothetical protein [unclassified Streptomyces]|uniref:hypothetical protein n=1 Tax=unclassified Streptomyces TaxID=2593676 RepID=UPI0036D1E21D